MGLIDKSAWGQVLAWHPTDDKPSPESKMTHFSDVYMRHQAAMGYFVSVRRNSGTDWSSNYTINMV